MATRGQPRTLEIIIAQLDRRAEAVQNSPFDRILIRDLREALRHLSATVELLTGDDLSKERLGNSIRLIKSEYPEAMNHPDVQQDVAKLLNDLTSGAETRDE